MRWQLRDRCDNCQTQEPFTELGDGAGAPKPAKAEMVRKSQTSDSAGLP